MMRKSLKITLFLLLAFCYAFSSQAQIENINVVPGGGAPDDGLLADGLISVNEAVGDITISTDALQAVIGIPLILEANANILFQGIGILSLENASAIRINADFDGNGVGDFITDAADVINADGPGEMFDIIANAIDIGSINGSAMGGGVNINLEADEINFGSSIGSVGGTLTILPRSTTTDVTLGGTADSGTGSLDLTTNDLSFLEQFADQTIGSTATSGNMFLAGDVSFVSRTQLRMTGGGTFPTFETVLANEFNLDGGGNNLTLTFGGDVSIATIMNNGANINISTVDGDITMLGTTNQINSGASGGVDDASGSVDISAGGAGVVNITSITANNNTPGGNAGGIMVTSNTGTITIGDITSNAVGAIGNGGAISVTSTSGNIITADISSTSGADSGSGVTVTSGGTVTTGVITSQGTNGGGSITLMGQSVDTQNGNLTAQGNAINLTATAGTVSTGALLSTSDGGGDITISASGDITTNQIDASGFNMNAAGNVDIQGANITINGPIDATSGGGSILLNGANIMADGASTSGGNGGNAVDITASGTLSSGVTNFSASTGATAGGGGGPITINAAQITSPLSLNSSGTNAGGAITVDVTGTFATIFENLSFSGDSGSGLVTITSNGELTFNNTLDGDVTAASGGLNDIMITSGGDMTFNGTPISIDAVGPNNGGNITLAATNPGSRINIVGNVQTRASSAGDGSTGGNVDIDADDDIIIGGFIDTRTNSGGAVDPSGFVDILSTNGAIEVQSIATLAQNGTGGNITLNAGGTDPTDGVQITGAFTDVPGQEGALVSLGEASGNNGTITITHNGTFIVNSTATPNLNGTLSSGPGNILAGTAVSERLTAVDLDASVFTSPLGNINISVPPAPFITTWQTDNPGTSATNQIAIPKVGGGYNYTVSWVELGVPGNNGTAGPFDDTNIEDIITFPTPGTYQVEISGDFPAILFGNGGDREKILTVEQWGSIAWQSMVQAFQGCTNLNVVAVDNPDLSAIIDMSLMFSGCTNFNGNIGGWDVSTVTSMRSLFDGASAFNQDISSWNVSSVTNMERLFAVTTVFNQPLNTWDVSSVTNMSGMFSFTDNFNQPLDTWNVSSVTDFSTMFQQADAFNQDLNTWNLAAAQNLFRMFTSTDVFNGNISAWNVSTVTSMAQMFSGAQAFNGDITGWNTVSVTTMTGMFQGAQLFNQDISTWDVSNVIDMGGDRSTQAFEGGMFDDAVAFNQNLGSWDISSVLDMEQMFDGSGLSVANYEATLAGWAFLDIGGGETAIPSGITLGATGLFYTTIGLVNRDLLTNPPNDWMINGDVLLPDLEMTDATWADTDLNGDIDQVTITFNTPVDISDPLGAVDGFDGIAINDGGGAVLIDAVDYSATNTTTLTLNFSGDQVPGTGITSLLVTYNGGTSNIITTTGALELGIGLNPTANTDVAPPIPVIITPNVGTDNPINITIDFGEGVTGFTESGLSLTNAQVLNFTDVDGQIYTADLYPTADGNISADIAANIAQDAAANLNLAASQFNILATIPQNAIQTDVGPTFVDISSVNAADFSSGYTIEFWTFPIQGSGDSDVLTLDAPDGTDLLRFNYVATFDRYDLFSGSTLEISSTGGLNSNLQWVHFAFSVAADGTASMYQNGELRGTATGFPIPTSTDLLTIGANWDGTNFFNPYPGRTEAFRVWNVARTQQEIVDNASLELTSTPNLVASYNFNHTSGNALDESNFNTGINNGAFYTASTAFDTDEFAPLFQSGTPFADAITVATFNINYNLNEAADVFYVGVPRGDAAPTSANVQGLVGNGGAVPIVSGTATYTNINVTEFLSAGGIAPGSALDVYIVAVDVAGNVQDNPLLVQVDLLPALNIVSTAPTANQINVAPTANIVITFDNPVNQTSIDQGTPGDFTDDNIIVKGQFTGVIQGTYSGDGTTTITFDPTQDFKVGETITVTITGGVQGMGGETAVAQTFTFLVETQVAAGMLVASGTTALAGSNDHRDIDLGDINGDGFLDLVLADHNDGVNDFRFITNLNDGTGAFPSAVEVENGDFNASAVALDDVDRDGDLDLAVHENTGFGSVAIRVNDGVGGYSGGDTRRVQNAAATDIYFVDLLNDGTSELLIYREANGSPELRVLDIVGNAFVLDTNPDFAASLFDAELTSTSQALEADFNQDGRIDILAGRFGGNSVLYLNSTVQGSTSPTFNDQPVSPRISDNHTAIAANFDADNFMDFAAISGGNLSVFTFNGSDFNAASFTVSTDHTRVAAGDFDGDGDVDMITAGGANNEITVWANNGSASFTELWTSDPNVLQINLEDIAVGDINNDGILDAAFSYRGAPVSVFFNTVPPPAAPTNLFVTEVTATQIDLSWLDNATDEAEFVLQRTTDINFTTFDEMFIPANAGTGTVNITDPFTIAPDEVYYYRVAANGNSNTSEFSNIEVGTTLTQPGNALNFDGIDDEVVVSDPGFDFGTTISIEAWIRTTDMQGAIVSHFNAVSPNDGFSFEIGGSANDGRLSFRSANGGVANFVTDLGSIVVSDGDWHHVAVTYDGVAGVRFYVDGSPTGFFPPGSASIGIAGNDLFLGRDANTAPLRLLAGDLDEVRIWSDVRTDAEISTSYLMDLVGNEDALFAYYKFDQGLAAGANADFTILPDRSINQNNGALSGTFDLGAGDPNLSNWIVSGAFSSTMPVNTFVGPGTSWNDPTNWSTGEVPAMDQDIIIDAVADLDVNGTPTFGTLTINAGASLDMTTNNLSFTGDVSIDGSLLLGSSTTFISNGNFTLTPAGNLEGGSNTNIVLDGDLSMSGNVIEGTNSITMQGAGSRTISGTTGAISLSSLNVSSSTTLTILNSVFVGFNFVNEGIFIIGGTSTLGVGGDFTNLGSFDANGNSVSLGANGGVSNLFVGSGITFDFVQISTGGIGNIITHGAITINQELDLFRGILVVDPSVFPDAALTLSNTASVINASSDSYVEGPITKQGTTDFQFPVGKNGIFAPVNMSALSGIDDVSVEYFDTDFGGIPGPTLDVVSPNEFWSIVGVNGESASFEFDYNDNAPRFSGVTDPTNLAIAVLNAGTNTFFETMNSGSGTGTPAGLISSGQVIIPTDANNVFVLANRTGGANFPSNAFITTWITTDGQITIPTDALLTYNYDVTWTNLSNPGVGDGTLSAQTADAVISGLTNGDTYEVAITGIFPTIFFNAGGDVLKIQSIEQWGNIAWDTFFNSFNGCSNLTYNATDAPDLSLVQDMSFMFAECAQFDGNLSGWDMSGVGNVFAMFRGTMFNNGGDPGIDGWDVGNIVNYSETFSNTPFNQPIGSWTINSVSPVIMTAMFTSATAFDQDLSGWDVSQVTDMREMFTSTPFNQNISGWNVANVSDMADMFRDATLFDQNLETWDISSVTTMVAMLNNTALSITNYDATLNGWSTLDPGETQIPSGITLDAQGLQYTATGQVGRDILTNIPNDWMINGDALVVPLAAPTDLIAFASSATEITLQWTDNSPDEDNFVVERADNFDFTIGVTVVDGTVPMDATTLTFDASLFPNAFYRVSAVNAGGTGESSVEFASTEPFSGQALNFDRGMGQPRYVGVPDNPDLDFVPGSDATFEFWMNAGSLTTTVGASKTIIDKSEDDGMGGLLTNYRIFIFDDGQGGNARRIGLFNLGSGVVTSDIVVPFAEWVHVAISISGGTVTFYLDGEQSGAPVAFDFDSPVNGLLTIGSQVDEDFDRDYTSFLDEVRIHNIAKVDFSDRFENLRGDEAGLVAYYPFDENTGATTVDRSQGISDGSLINNPAFVTSGPFPLPTPFVFNAVNVTTAGFTADFTPPDGALDILVDVATDNGFVNIVADDISVGLAGQGTVNTPLSVNTEYYYRAKAVFAGGNSDYVVSNAFMVMPGNALAFNGVDDVVSFRDPINLAYTDFTFEIWLRSPSGGVGQRNFYRQVDPAGGVQPQTIELGVNSGNAFMLIRSENGGAEFTAQGTQIVADDTWHHLAFVREGTELRIYVDGVLDNTGAIAPANITFPTTSTSALGGATGLNASLDEFRVWNVVRDEATILDQLDNELVGNDFGLISYYRFDQGIAGGVNTGINELLDLTGGNIGDLVGFDFGVTDVNQSNWVTSGAFVTPPEAPFVFNAVNVTTAGFTADFTPPAGAVDVVIDLSDDPGFSNLILDDQTVGLGGSSVVNTALTPGVEYFWRAKAIFSGGDSQYAVANSFMVRPGNALRFDGVDDFVSVPSLNFPTGSFTLETWVNYEGAFGAFETILEFGDDSPFFGLTNGLITVFNDIVTSPDPIVAGVWTHLAVTYDDVSNDVILYVNGAQVAQGNQVLNFTGAGLGIGFNNGDSHFTGSIDEVRIWEVTRSQADIQAHLTQELVGNDTGLLAYYRFDQGVAGVANPGINVLTDLTGNHDGTLSVGFDLGAADVNQSNWVTSGALQFTAPAAPTELVAYSVSPTEVVLEWVDNANNEQGYLIERADDFAFTTNVFEVVNNLSANSTNFTFVAGVDQPYFYRVTAINGSEDATSQSAVEFATTVEPAAFAVDFDGNDDVASLTGLGLGIGDFTIEAWINPNVVTGTQSFFNNREGNIAGTGNWISLRLVDDRVNWIIGAGGTAGFSQDLSTSVIAANQWTHVAITKEGLIWSIYINGILDKQLNGVDERDLTITSTSFEIGNWTAGGEPYSGQIDELRIWGFPRAEFEIDIERFGPLIGTEPNLLAYYSFDENIVGSTIVDRSINTLDATTVIPAAPNYLPSDAFTPPENVFIGAIDDLWSNPGNWLSGEVPSDGQDIIIDAPLATLDLATTPTFGGLLIIDGATLDMGTNNLTFSGPAEINGILTLNTGNVLTTGDLAIGALGTLNAGSNTTLNVGGNYIQDGTMVEGTSTVNLQGTSVTISGTATPDVLFHNLDIQLGTTLNAAITLTGNLTVANSGLLTAEGNNINLSGDYTLSGGAGFDPGTSTFTFNGSGGNQNIFASAGITFNNLTINNLSGVVGNGDMNVSGVLDLTAGNISFLGLQRVTMIDGSSIINASQTSFIAAPVVKIGGTDFTFPVGTGDVFAPVAMSGLSAGDEVVVDYLNSGSGNGFGSNLAAISPNEFWTITSVTGSVTATFTFDYRDDGFRTSGVTDPANLVVAQTDLAGTFEEIAGSGPGVGSPNGTIATGPITIPSSTDNEFTLADNLSGTNFFMDNTAPTITSITRFSPLEVITNADALTWEVTFSEPVLNVTADDFSITATTATVTNVVNTVGDTYSVTISGGDLAAVDGVNVTLTVVPNDIVDVSAQANALVDVNPTGVNDNFYSLDNTAPTVAVSTPLNPTNATAIPFTVNFTEVVTGFEMTDVVITNGTIQNFVDVSGDVYNFEVAPTTEGNVTVDIATDVALDAAGNGNLAAAQVVVLSDQTAPSVTITSMGVTDPTNEALISMQVLFDEPVTGFDVTDLAVAGGIAQDFTGSGDLYTFNLAPTVNGIVTVDIAAGAALDAADNDNLAAPQFSITFDNLAPTISNISSPTATDPTNFPIIPIAIDFSESVVGFSALGVSVSGGTVSNFAGSGSNYTFDVTPLAEGTITIDVLANVVTDLAGNDNLASAPFTIVSDRVAPTPAITSGVGSPTSAPVILMTVIFGEEVTGFDIGDIAIVGGTASNLLDMGGGTFTFDATPTADGLLTVDIPANIANDLAGNANNAAAQLALTIDQMAPTPVIGTTAPDPTNAASIPFTVDFSETVTGFDVTDLVVVGGTVSNFVDVDGANYSFDVNPSADGLLTVDIAAGAALDVAGNMSDAATQFTIMIDQMVPVPTISSTEMSPTNATSILVSINFGEVVTGFDATDLSIVNGTAAGFANVDGQNYTFDVIPTADGILTVDVAAGAASDAAGNLSDAAIQFSIEVDQGGPTPVITSLAPNPTNANVIAVEVAFGEPVIGFDQTDLVVLNGIVSNFTDLGVGNFSFEVAPTADGTVTVDIAANVATDQAGNGNLEAVQFSVESDQTNPTVIISTTAADPTNLPAIPITVTFSEDVVNFDETDLIVSGVTVANFAGGGTTYSFDALTSVDGPISVDINANVAEDLAGNSNEQAGQFTIVFDGTLPVVTVDPLATFSTSSELTGTVDEATSSLMVTVDGLTLVAINNNDGTWVLPAGSLNTLSPGLFDVEVSAIDLAGNNALVTATGALEVYPTPTALLAQDINPFSFTAVWEEIPGVTEYLLDVSLDESFDMPISGFDGLQVTGTSQLVTGLDYSTTYFYRVRGVASPGDISQVSNTVELLTSILSGTIADQAALQRMFTEMGGIGWNRQDGWSDPMERIENYVGVTVVLGRVTSIDLNANNLINALPVFSGEELDQMTNLNLFDNEVDGLGDLTVISALNNVDVRQNTLSFESIEPNLAIPNFQFIGQKLILDEVSPLESEGDDIVLDRTVGGGPANTYVWFRDGVEIPGETDGTLALSAITFADEASYNVQASNPNVPGLTLTTNPVVLRVSSLERDSVALREVFLATQGAGGWENRPGWIDGNLDTWEGVGISGQRVTTLDISSSNVAGTIPSDILDIVNLTSIDLSGNEIDSIPSFSSLQFLTSLDVRDNFIQFDDLEANAGQAGFEFTGQLLRDMAIQEDIPVGNDFTVSVDVGGANNQYQWMLDGVEVAGATNPEFLIASIGRANDGRYECVITNPGFTALTFTSAANDIYAVANVRGFARVAGQDGEFVEDGLVRLLAVRDGAYDTIQPIMSLGAGGEYLYENVRLDDYVINVDPTDRETFLPTYFEQVIQWDFADTLRLNTDTTGIDVNVEPIPVPGDFGVGSVGGEVFSDFPEDGRLEVRRRVRRVGCALRRRRGQGRPEGRRPNGRVEMDDDGFELFSYQTTDDNGQFVFEDLPTGTYRLFIEYPGIPLDPNSFTEFEISEDPNEDDVAVAVTVFEDGILIEEVDIVSVPEDYLQEVTIFPNPAKGELFVRVQSGQAFELKFELLDLRGVPIVSDRVVQTNLIDGARRMDISGLSPGVYLIRITLPDFDNQVFRTGKLIITE